MGGRWLRHADGYLLVIIQLKALKDNGIECNYVTGGGTGSFPYEAGSGVFTEVQPVSLYNIHVQFAAIQCIFKNQMGYNSNASKVVPESKHFYNKIII